MPFPILPVIGIGGLVLLALNAQNKKAQVRAEPPTPPPPVKRPPVVKPPPIPPPPPNVKVPTDFAPPPATVPIAAGTRVNDVIFTKEAPPVTFDPNKVGTVTAGPVTVLGTPRTETQSAAHETSKRSTKDYYKWAQAGLNKTTPKSARSAGFTADLSVDGIFGAKSKQMTKDFQNMVNKEIAASGGGVKLVVDGIVGENTELQLFNRGAGEPPWMKG